MKTTVIAHCAQRQLQILSSLLEPDPAQPRWLLTEPGMGYRFQPDPDGEI